MRERGTLGDWNREALEQRGKKEPFAPTTTVGCNRLKSQRNAEPTLYQLPGRGEEVGRGEAWCIKVLPLGQVGLHPPHELKFSGNDA